jgi:uncharacterized protein (DUF427 family)
MKAIWNNQVIAESAVTVVVDSNHYFPPNSVNETYLRHSPTTSNCAWKGVANYYSLQVDGDINPDAAWYYPSPKDAAAEIRGHLAFWRGVKIVDG